MKFPRLKFGLKTLFVAIAAVAVLLYWIETQRQFVRARNDFALRKAEQYWTSEAAEAKASQNHPTGPLPTIPWIRRQFGDHAYYWIILPANSSKDTQQEALTLFTEANIDVNSPETLISLQFRDSQ